MFHSCIALIKTEPVALKFTNLEIVEISDQGCYELIRELSTNSQQTEYGIKQNVETSSLKKGHEKL